MFRGAFFLVAAWNLFLEGILSEAGQVNPYALTAPHS